MENVENTQQPTNEQSAQQQQQQSQNNGGYNGPQTQVNVIIANRPKSMAAAFLLTFFFGPLGLLYANVMGAIIMIVITIILSLICIFFPPLIFIFIVTQIICIVWACVSVDRHNKSLNIQTQSYQR